MRFHKLSLPISGFIVACFSHVALSQPPTKPFLQEIRDHKSLLEFASSESPRSSHDLQAEPSSFKTKTDKENDELRRYPNIAVSGVFDLWTGTAFGEALGGSFPNKNSKTPPGRDFGGPSTEVFKLRRGNINLKGGLTKELDYRIQFNLAKFGTESGSALQEIWLGYRFSPEFKAEFGRQKTGLSEEGSRSSKELLTIARSLMNESLPAKSGRVGTGRATGLVLRYQTGRIKSFIGLWDGNGENQSLLADNHLNFLNAGVYLKTLRRFTFGVWGGRKISNEGAKEVRDRFGGTMLFESGPHVFEIEGAYARDFGKIADRNANGGSIAIGFYILYAHRISKQWQLVARYDVWDPAQHDLGDTLTETGVLVPQSDHKLKEYTFGVNYTATEHIKLQLNYIREDPEINGYIFFGKPRTVLLSNVKFTF